ncbi:hypothetical protein AZI86_06085 [Bdellovibrio bacteriovorus]|uniref:Uncharacterized protein n=1 Tax=Bdellovibrio bacteriovorus TaxID=959 RepID=A0A150WQ54_BDEBC|nr:RnfABCDGE type electron transport complex subunit D [Bdellovibrio bacteriovorus]KYG66612.1 hypothetical protein AZI86_06085 [Bdellovibrio bacteriovorus]
MMTKKGFIYPSYRDPRLHFLLFAVFFIWFALSTMSFGRTPQQFLFCLVLFSTLEFIFVYLYKHQIAVPTSGMVSSIGAFLLVDTQYPLVMATIAFLTIASKYYIRIDGRHIFNPNNFAIVIIALAMPNMVSPVGGLRWGGELWVGGTIFAMGLLLVWSANRFFVSVSYLATFFTIGMAFKMFAVNRSLYTLLSPGTQLFVFFMISDPKTSPNRLKAQILFGAGIAIIDHCLRLIQFRLATLTALFIATLFYAIINKYTKDKQSTETWVNLTAGKEAST